MKAIVMVIAALGVLAAPAQAQEVRFGLQGHVSIPMGDLKDAVDSKPGLGLGAHVAWEFQPQMQLRGRIDHMQFPNVKVSTLDTKVSNLSYGVDYLYSFQGQSGSYVLGGLSLNRWEQEVNMPVMGMHNASTTRLGVALGGGFAFNRNVSMEARYVMSSFDAGTDASFLQATVLYRF